MAVGDLQLALQWQYELLRCSHVNQSSVTKGVSNNVKDLTKSESSKETAHLLRTSSSAISKLLSTEGKPPSLSSFDSGFDTAGSSQLEACREKEGVEDLSRLTEYRDSLRSVLSQPQVAKEKVASVSQEIDFGSVRNSTRSSIQIIPKATVESINFEIKVKRSAALPSNPWLSLSIDNLESSYTVTITPNPTPQMGDLQFQDPSDLCMTANQPNRSHDQPTQTEVLSSTQSRGLRSMDWILHSQSNLEDSHLCPIDNILSSTITDDGERSMSTTQGTDTLLWDSYDLHEQHSDTFDG